MKGFKQAKFKGFPTRDEAEEFIKINAQKLAESQKQKKVDEFFTTDGPATKKIKKAVKINTHITMYFDGGSRGNGKTLHPVAGSGAVLQIIDKDKQEEKTIKLREFLDEQHICRAETLSNNFAEYMALIIGLKEIRKDEHLVTEGAKSTAYGDSKLVINEASGTYACRAENIFRLYTEAKRIIKEFKREGKLNN